MEVWKQVCDVGIASSSGIFFFIDDFKTDDVRWLHPVRCLNVLMVESIQ
jgi:hypothetical protein